MNDKDSKLIWENFNEGRQPGDNKDIAGYFNTISALIAGGKVNPDATTFDTEDDFTGVNALAQEFMSQTARPDDQDATVIKELKAVEDALYELHATLADYVEGNKAELTDFAYDGDGDDWVAGLFDKDGDEI